MIPADEADDKAKLEEYARADEKVKTFIDGKEVIKVIVIPKTHLVNIVVK
jgi:leucyl-tRNA synthetase